MNSFKDIAYQILKEAGKPLHCSDVTSDPSFAWVPSPLSLRGITQRYEMGEELRDSVRFHFTLYFVRGNHG